MTIRKARNFSKRRRRVPVAEVYSIIPGNFRTAYANGTGQSGVEVVPTHDRVEVDGVTVPPDPIFRKGEWFSSKPAVAPQLQMYGLETTSAAGHNGRGPDSSLKRLWVFVQTYVWPYG